MATSLGWLLDSDPNDRKRSEEAKKTFSLNESALDPLEKQAADALCRAGLAIHLTLIHVPLWIAPAPKLPYRFDGRL